MRSNNQKQPCSWLIWRDDAPTRVVTERGGPEALSDHLPPKLHGICKPDGHTRVLLSLDNENASWIIWLYSGEKKYIDISYYKMSGTIIGVS